jgi:hypothetical protein
VTSAVVTFDILDQTPDLFPGVIARHFVVRVPEEAFDGIGFGAIGRQKHQLDAAMGGQPWFDRLRFVNLVVGYCQVERMRS